MKPPNNSGKYPRFGGFYCTGSYLYKVLEGSGGLLSRSPPVASPKKEVREMKFHAIRENHLYAKAYAKGKKCAAHYVTVYLLPDWAAKRLAKPLRSQLPYNRIGITVGKKIGSAVERNRSKRIIREGIRQAMRQNPVRQGFLIVVVAKPSILERKTVDLTADFVFAFRKLGLAV